jgi:aspartate/methionine/tyrosine aminotransferase
MITHAFVFFNSYYEWLRLQFLKKRNTLEKGLLAVGIEPIASQGGFFVMGKLPETSLVDQYGFMDEPYDWRYCRLLIAKYGVSGIPTSTFFSPNSVTAKSIGPTARFAFCKKDKTIIDAVNRLTINALP